MIIVDINGGLGNQLFQFAFGLNLAKKLNTELYLYNNDLKYNWLRKYELDKFKLSAKCINKKTLNKFFATNKITKFTEQEDDFLTNENNLINNCFYHGFWQSEDYFAENVDKIKSEINFDFELTKTNKKLLDKIQNCESVCIHLRRGDYITKKDTQALYGGICTEEYYKKAIEKIKESVKKPYFFIFSDDIEWAKKNFKLENSTYIDGNYKKFHSSLENNYIYRNAFILLKYFFKDKPHIDLKLMKSCKHFIIANSSFSWWWAWLSDNKEKIVIAPAKWRNDYTEGMIKQSQQIVPNDWIKI